MNTIANASSIFRNWVNSNPKTAEIAETVEKSVNNTVNTMVENTDKLVSNITTNKEPSGNADKGPSGNTNVGNVMKGGANRRTRMFLRPRRKRKTHKITYQI